MENQNDNSSSSQQINNQLFEKSAELKKKNAALVEKLEALKKQTEKLLNHKPISGMR